MSTQAKGLNFNLESKLIKAEDQNVRRRMNVELERRRLENGWEPFGVGSRGGGESPDRGPRGSTSHKRLNIGTIDSPSYPQPGARPRTVGVAESSRKSSTSEGLRTRRMSRASRLCVTLKP